MRKKTYLFSLIFILIVQVFYLTLVFSFSKQGYHSDEVYNYGFANSYYMKDLNNFDSDDSIFFNWEDSQLFKDYISVDKDHRFSYDAVIKNCNLDFNPPFQFLILHTICSFFPGIFSWYFCFAINIVSYIISQIYIFKLSKNITNKSAVGLCAVILYGFCVGALDITIFLRIYALGTMFIVIFMYYSHKLYSDSLQEKKSCFLYITLSFISLLFGAYTMHIFLFPAFVITLCFCLYYLLSKSFRLFFSYGFSCLGAVCLSCLLYPKTFSNLGVSIGKSGISSSDVSYALIKYPFSMQLRLYAFQFTRDLFGFHISPLPNPYFEYFLIGLFCTIVLVTPFCFVFRKEEWFKKFIIKIKNRLIYAIKNIKKLSFSLIVLFLSSLSVLLLVAWKTSWYLMKACANRYLFVVYPLASVFVIVIIYYIFKIFSNNSKISLSLLIIISSLLSTLSHFQAQSHAFLFQHYSEGVVFDDLEENSNCVLMLESPWTIVLFAPKLYKTNSFYATTISDYRNNTYFDNVDCNQPYYVILNLTYLLDKELDASNPDDKNIMDIYGETAKLFTVESEIVSFFESEENVNYLEYVGTDELMQRGYHIYKVHFK